MRISDWSSDVCSSDLKFVQILRRDADAFRFAFQNLAQRLARETRDLALEGADARLARVIADQIAQSFVGQFELARLQPMSLDLLREQMELGDLDLLVLGIALEQDNHYAGKKGVGHV